MKKDNKTTKKKKKKKTRKKVYKFNYLKWNQFDMDIYSMPSLHLNNVHADDAWASKIVLLVAFYNTYHSICLKSK